MAGGQPTPPRILEAFAINAPSVTAPNGTAGAKTNPFPEASQIGVLNGAASLNDGFVPLNMTPQTSGGVPPFGEDMNGILYLLSAWVAALAAGQVPQYDATLSAAMDGYALGAVLQQAADTTAFWISTVAGNVTDPDSSGAGWVSTKALYSAVALSGTDNVVLPGPSDYFINMTAAAGPFTGFVAQRDGQKITFVNTSGGNVQFNALATSAADNQLQLPANVVVSNNDTLTFQYNSGLEKWAVV